MATFPGGIEINPAASYLAPAINNAAALYGQIQQLKLQREELTNKKIEAQYNVGMKLMTDPKLPPSIKVRAYKNAIQPYIEKLSPGASFDISEDDFKSGSIQSLIDEISPIYNSKDYTKEQKQQMMAIPFAKFQNQHGLNKEAASTLMGGFGVASEPGKIDYGNIDSLRKEFTALPQVKDFQSVASAYQKIKVGGQKNSAAGDLSLIFAYMKMLDPGSTVREGEFATAEQAAGVPTRILNQYNKVVRGERLAPEQRADFTETAKSIYSGQEKYVALLENQYKKLATDRGLDPAQALIDLRIPVDPTDDTSGKSLPLPSGQPTNGKPKPKAPPDSPSPGPKPGTVESGYRFKGGDPANAANWEKMK